MVGNVSEAQMHKVRWVLLVFWGILIYSLFWDPISPQLTDSSNTLSPISLDLNDCVEVQNVCLDERPYPLGARIFWSIVIPGSVFILLVFGHELWRRICPLSFVSQLPAAIGIQRKRSKINRVTGRIKKDPIKIERNSWLGRNYLSLQCLLFYLGLNARVLFVNSNRMALSVLLIGTIIAAIVIGYLYAGKSWCHYICPMAPVQKVYAEPRGLLGSSSHIKTGGVTQSMCRTLSNTPNCTGCQSTCIDIDSENSYWSSLSPKDKRLIHYGYIGLLLGFYFFYYLYAGNWDYYYSGAWTHEERQLSTLLSPGFYLMGTIIHVPKIVAAPITIAIFGLVTHQIGKTLERIYERSLRVKYGERSKEIALHRSLAISTFLAFNLFFRWSGRPNIELLPDALQLGFDLLILLVSSAWLFRTWPRSVNIYRDERKNKQSFTQLKSSKQKVGANLSIR